MMKKLVIAVAGLALLASAAHAQGTHTTRGYTTSNGTVVSPYVATNPNGTTSDNFSTRGNTNPYTGRPGTR